MVVVPQIAMVGRTRLSIASVGEFFFGALSGKVCEKQLAFQFSLFVVLSVGMVGQDFVVLRSIFSRGKQRLRHSKGIFFYHVLVPFICGHLHGC